MPPIEDTLSIIASELKNAGFQCQINKESVTASLSNRELTTTEIRTALEERGLIPRVLEKSEFPPLYISRSRDITGAVKIEP